MFPYFRDFCWLFIRFYSDYVNTDQHNFFLLRVIWIVDEVLISYTDWWHKINFREITYSFEKDKVWFLSTIVECLLFRCRLRKSTLYQSKVVKVSQLALCIQIKAL